MLDKQPGASFFYESYLNCILQLKNYGEGEKELKKLLKSNRNNYIVQVDLGYLYSLENGQKQSDKQNAGPQVGQANSGNRDPVRWQAGTGSGVCG